MKVESSQRITFSRVEVTRIDGGAPPATLLPSPSHVDAADYGDAMAQLYALIAARRSGSEHTSKARVAVGTHARDAAFERAKAAVARAQAHRPESGRGFFGSIGKLVGDFVSDVSKAKLAAAVNDLGKNAKDIAESPKFWKELEQGALLVAKGAAIVGAACATVASFGAAAPAAVVLIVGVGLSTAGFVENELHVLEACGVDADVAGYIGMGMSIGGALAGGVGGVMAASGTAASCSGTIASGASKVGVGFNVAAGGSQMVAGGAHVVNGEFAATAEHATADEKQARNDMARIDRMVTMLIESMTSNDASAERTLQTLGEAMQTHNRSLVLSSTRG